jgi:acyl carrier protein
LNAKEQNIVNFIKNIISKECDIAIDTIAPENSFFELGLDSISAVYLLELAENECKLKLNLLLFWDYPTIQTFSNKLFTDNFKQ